MCFRTHSPKWFCITMYSCVGRFNVPVPVEGNYHHHQQQQQQQQQLSFNHEGRWGITDDFITSFLHFSLFSTALWDLANSRPVHFLMLSSHLILCLPCLLLRPFHCALQDGFGQT